MRFEWDPEKDAANQAAHDLSFSEAKQLFVSGLDCLEIFDALHSLDEDRFITIGPISRGVILVVWTEREEDIIRIISARMATKDEQSRYFRFLENQS